MNEELRGWRCQRQGANGRPLYVEALPGDGGKDWGYTADPQKAIFVSGYWRARFLADMHKCAAHGINAVSMKIGA